MQVARNIGVLKKKAARLGREAFDRRPPAPGAVTPFTPVASIAGAPTPPAWAGVRSAVGDRCDVRPGTVSSAASASQFAATLSAEFLDNQLPTLMRSGSLSRRCKDRILASIVRETTESVPSAETRRRLVELLRLYVPATGAARTQFDQHASCILGDQNPLLNLRLLETDVREINSCTEVPVGGSRNIDWADGESSTGVEAQYKLTRPSANEYRAELNVTFTSDGVTPGTPAARAFNQRTRAEAERCLTDHASILSPPGGPRLTVSLVPTSGRPAPPPIGIKVVADAGHRADSHAWAPSTSSECSTMIHELMHRIGMVDQYKETSMGYRTNPDTGAFEKVENATDDAFQAWNCRSLGPEDTLMSSQTTAMAAVIPRYRMLRCLCRTGIERDEAEVQSCRRGIANLTSVANPRCPGRASTGLDVPAVPPPAPGRLLGGVASYPRTPRIEIDEDGNAATINLLTTPTRESLLRPAEVRAITHPGCAVGNSMFYTCARPAYRTSADRLGDGCPKGQPAACRDPEAWLR